MTVSIFFFCVCVYNDKDSAAAKKITCFCEKTAASFVSSNCEKTAYLLIAKNAHQRQHNVLHSLHRICFVDISILIDFDFLVDFIRINSIGRLCLKLSICDMKSFFFFQFRYNVELASSNHFNVVKFRAEYLKMKRRNSILMQNFNVNLNA